MADRVMNQVRGMGRELVLLPLSFICNGTLAPTSRVPSQHGVASIARTGVGTFVVTLQDGFVDYRSLQATVKSTAATPVVAWAMIGATDTQNGKTFTVYTANASGTVADFSAANAIEVNLLLVLKNAG